MKYSEETAQILPMAVLTTLMLGIFAMVVWQRSAGRPAQTEDVMEATMVPAFAPPNAADAADPGSFAVVELFTSQACSSCPPADKLLNQIAEESRNGSTTIIPLSFHVDYWDKMGWSDPFSQLAYSEYQFAYSRALRLSSVYTPQMIVNGTDQFVGSDGERAGKSIRSALARQATDTVRIAAERVPDSNMIAVEYQVRGAREEKATLNIAVVERGITTKVKRGENGGKTLRHENVVRVFKPITITPRDVVEGKVRLRLPKEVNPENIAVVGYVQDRETMGISGATMVEPEVRPGM